MKPRNILLLLLLSLGAAQISLANTKVLKIYHDSDYSSHAESALSMSMGLQTALDEINNQIQGYQLQLVKKDHRGNSSRSQLHMKQFLKDPHALFMLGGLHSPPYIRHRKFINENGVLLLVPWAAGGPITRYSEGQNWVFRLSVDDTKAGYRIGQFAVNQLGCNVPHLLLEDTPWGKSNFKTMTKALVKELGREPQVSWFNWNTTENAAKVMLRDIIEKRSECILFVGNAVEGEQFSKAMASFESSQRVPIVSHWGITGGDFHKVVNADIRKGLDLHFIQTCFSFISSPNSPLKTAVFDRAKKLFPSRINTVKDIPAPPGFIHAYDLGRIVISALQELELSGDIAADRTRLRAKLENLSTPVQGLIKSYQAPFSQWSVENDDAHEALGLNDFCMARYDENNNVIVNLNN